MVLLDPQTLIESPVWPKIESLFPLMTAVTPATNQSASFEPLRVFCPPPAWKPVMSAFPAMVLLDPHTLIASSAWPLMVSPLPPITRLALAPTFAISALPIRSFPVVPEPKAAVRELPLMVLPEPLTLTVAPLPNVKFPFDPVRI